VEVALAIGCAQIVKRQKDDFYSNALVGESPVAMKLIKLWFGAIPETSGLEVKSMKPVSSLNLGAVAKFHARLDVRFYSPILSPGFRYYNLCGCTAM
jgi:hypothetical protein